MKEPLPNDKSLSLIGTISRIIENRIIGIVKNAEIFVTKLNKYISTFNAILRWVSRLSKNGWLKQVSWVIQIALINHQTTTLFWIL